MRAILGENTFEVIKLEGLEELFYGFSFRVTLSGYYDSSIFPIGEMIKVGPWKGRIATWSVEEFGIHENRFFSCNFISSLQYLCSKEKWYVYKNLDFRSIIKKIIGTKGLEAQFNCREGRKYDQLIQYSDSDHSFIKHLACENDNIFWINPREDIVVFYDDQNWNSEVIQLVFGRLQSEERVHILRAFVNSSDCPEYNFFMQNLDNKFQYSSESGKFYWANSCENKISVGTFLQLEEQRADMQYKIVKVKHIIDEDGYRNEFIMFETQDAILPLKFSLPSISGPQLAKVISNTGSFVELDFDDWPTDTDSITASVAQLFASEGQGAFFVPQPGERVLALFSAGSRSDCFVIGSLYTKTSPANYLSSEIKSIKTRSNYDENKCFELVMDPSKDLLKLRSDGMIHEEIIEDKLLEIQNGGLRLFIGKDNLLKINKNSLNLNIINGQMVLNIPEISIVSSSLTLHSNNLKISGNQVDISSINLNMQSKVIEISSSELKIKSAKVDIS